jgi:hypothetical protein
MTKFNLSHEINCTPETFWKIFLDKEFNQDLYLKGLGFPEFTILDQRETDTETIRKVSGKPKLNMPGPIMKLLGNGFGYTEDGKLNKSTKIWTWKFTPSTLAEKLRNEGTMRVEPIGDKRCRRLADIVLEAKIFGLGGLVESSAEKSLREGWDHSAVFMNKWIADKSLT